MLLVRVAVIARKAHVDMPARVTGVGRMREPHRKRSEALARNPAPLADELIEGSMENRGVRRLAKWLSSVPGEPNDGPCPCRLVVWIARDVAPHDCSALLCPLPRKCAIYADEPVLNELVHLRAAQRARARLGSHDSSVVEPFARR